MPNDIPVIDLATSHARESIAKACREVGSFLAVGHGVAVQVVEGAWTAAQRFFDLPMDRKLEVRRVGSPYGFEVLSHEALAGTPTTVEADVLQAFDVGPPLRGPGSGPGAHERIWPTEPYEFRPALLNYYAEMERLSARLLELMAPAMGVEPGFFEPYTDAHLSVLRILDHPETQPGSNAARTSAHTDHGSLTLVRTDARVGGVEVEIGDGNWIAIPLVEDSFVVNIGDLMHRWSNGRWRSTKHRVAGDSRGRRHTSVAYFHNPNWDAVIEPIRLTPDEESLFEPIQAGPRIEPR